MIQAYVDQVMLQWFRGPIEVGYYSAAIKLISAMGFVPMILKNSLFPAIVNAKNESIEFYNKRMLNYYRLSFLVFLIFSIPIFFISEDLVVFLFGEEYQPAGMLFALSAFRLLFANMGVARETYLLNENLMKYSMVTLGIGTITNIGLNYLWIPAYGAEGAIVTTILSFFVSIFLCDFFYFKTRRNVILMFLGMVTFYKIKVK